MFLCKIDQNLYTGSEDQRKKQRERGSGRQDPYQNQYATLSIGGISLHSQMILCINIEIEIHRKGINVQKIQHKNKTFCFVNKVSRNVLQ